MGKSPRQPLYHILKHRSMYRDTCTHTDMHAKVDIDICVQLAVIPLAIPMNYVMGKWNYAPEFLLIPELFC